MKNLTINQLKLCIMKTFSFLLFVVIFVFAGCSKNDDILLETNDDLQLKSADTKTISSKVTNGYGEMPLTCDGVEIDYLMGSFDYHWVEHYKNGELQWMMYTSKGTVTSSGGENFIVQDVGKFDKSKKGPYLWHSNARGDKGTHLIFSGVVTFTVISEDPLVIEYNIEWTKTMCVPNK
jgi:hypothetical protein